MAIRSVNSSTTSSVTPAELTLFNRLTTPVWIFDIEQMRMWWANTAALTLWNADSLEELLNRDWSDYSEATEIRLQSYLDKFRQGDSVTEQWTFYPKGGLRFLFAVFFRHCNRIWPPGNAIRRDL